MDTYLAHYGILGMKWGVRRYQNEDGSLTSAGRERYGYGSSDHSHIKKNTTSKRHDSDVKVSTAGDNAQTEKIDTSARAIADYRAKVLGKNPTAELKERYKRMSDEDVRREMVRRSHVKKALIAAGIAGGTAAAVYVAYRAGAFENILAKMNAEVAVGFHAADAARHKPASMLERLRGVIVNETAEDVGYVLKEGDAIYRMQSFAGADTSKMSNAVFASHTKLDRSFYMTFLKDYAGTGERYAVDLAAKKDIRVPSLKEAQKIYQELYESEEYQKALRKTMSEMFSAQTKMPADDPAVRKMVSEALKNSEFYSGVWSLGKDGDSTKMFAKAFQDKGYDAITDYHDQGHFSNQPVIIFDPTNTLRITGEKLVTDGMRKEALETIVNDPSSVQWARAVSWLRGLRLQ